MIKTFVIQDVECSSRVGETIVSVDKANITATRETETFATEELLLARIQSIVPDCAKDVTEWFEGTLLYKMGTASPERFFIAEQFDNIKSWKFWSYKGRHNTEMFCLAIELEDEEDIQPDKEYQKKQETENRLVGFELEITGIDKYQAECKLDDDRELKRIFEFGDDCSIEAKGSCGGGRRYEMVECEECGYEHEEEVDCDEDNDTAEMRTKGGNPVSLFLKNRHEKIRDIIDIIEECGINGGAESSPEYTCGLHIHVKADEDELEHIARYARKHEDEVYALYEPDRGRASYCKKYTTYTPNPTIDYIVHNADRYSWLNIAQSWQQSRPTVEFRIFDGTLDPDEIAKRLRWAHNFICTAVREGKKAIAEKQRLYELYPEQKPYVYGTSTKELEAPTHYHADLYPVTDIYTLTKEEDDENIYYIVGEKIKTIFNKRYYTEVLETPEEGSWCVLPSGKLYESKEKGGAILHIRDNQNAEATTFKNDTTGEMCVILKYNNRPTEMCNVVYIGEVIDYNGEELIYDEDCEFTAKEIIRKDRTDIAGLKGYKIVYELLRVSIKQNIKLGRDDSFYRRRGYTTYLLYKDGLYYVAYNDSETIEKEYTGTLKLPTFDTEVYHGDSNRYIFTKLSLDSQSSGDRPLYKEEENLVIWKDVQLSNYIKHLRKKYLITKDYLNINIARKDGNIVNCTNFERRSNGNTVVFNINGEKFAITWSFKNNITEDEWTFDDSISYDKEIEKIINTKFDNKLPEQTVLASIEVVDHDYSGAERAFRLANGSMVVYNNKSLQDLIQKSCEYSSDRLEELDIIAGNKFYIYNNRSQICWQNLKAFKKYIIYKGSTMYCIMELPVIDGKVWNPLEQGEHLQKVEVYKLKDLQDTSNLLLGDEVTTFIKKEEDSIYNCSEQLLLDRVMDTMSHNRVDILTIINEKRFKMIFKQGEAGTIVKGIKDGEVEWLLAVTSRYDNPTYNRAWYSEEVTE
jgi:hypothetical protein